MIWVVQSWRCWGTYAAGFGGLERGRPPRGCWADWGPANPQTRRAASGEEQPEGRMPVVLSDSGLSSGKRASAAPAPHSGPLGAWHPPLKKPDRGSRTLRNCGAPGLWVGQGVQPPVLSSELRALAQWGPGRRPFVAAMGLPQGEAEPRFSRFS